MAGVKKTRRRGITRISAKNQVTIPVDALREAGLRAGDELRVAEHGPGRLTLVRVDDVVARFAGDMPGVYPPGYLDELRDEWR